MVELCTPQRQYLMADRDHPTPLPLPVWQCIMLCVGFSIEHFLAMANDVHRELSPLG
jgi:hypothetical protein